MSHNSETSVDISKEAVEKAALDMRTRGVAYRSDRDIADLLEALAADRDRAYARGLAEGRALGITVIGA